MINSLSDFPKVFLVYFYLTTASLFALFDHFHISRGVLILSNCDLQIIQVRKKESKRVSVVSECSNLFPHRKTFKLRLLSACHKDASLIYISIVNIYKSLTSRQTLVFFCFCFGVWCALKTFEVIRQLKGEGTTLKH